VVIACTSGLVDDLLAVVQGAQGDDVAPGSQVPAVDAEVPADPEWPAAVVPERDASDLQEPAVLTPLDQDADRRRPAQGAR
jgi:hypothetical protein